MKNEHIYAARLIWDGNTGKGTDSFAGYGRQYRILVAGKADLTGSADPLSGATRTSTTPRTKRGCAHFYDLEYTLPEQPSEVFAAARV